MRVCQFRHFGKWSDNRKELRFYFHNCGESCQMARKNRGPRSQPESCYWTLMLTGVLYTAPLEVHDCTTT